MVDRHQKVNSKQPEPETGKLYLPEMEKEQKQDPDLEKLRKTLEDPTTTEAVKKRYAVVDGLLYYLGKDDDDQPSMKLMVPAKYKNAVLQQYHEDSAHFGIDKCFNMIRQKYHWIGLYKDCVEHVSHCITCRLRSQKKVKVPLQEMDEVHYPGQKWSIDLTGPYTTSTSGNKYILTAVDHYSGWPEMWPIPDKRSENVVQLVMEELIPRFSVPEVILSDNGQEFKSNIFEQMLESLNIHHICTSPYHPQSNSRVERFHRVLHDMLSKKTSKHPEQWDTHLSSILQAVRAGPGESLGYSPFFLMYSRDPVLPLDNLLRPRRKYLGCEFHRQALERQHEAFMHVRRNLRKARRRQKLYHDKNAVDVKFEVGDPVYYENPTRDSKLDDRWVSHYRVIEVNSPVTCTIRNQLTGDVRRVHKEHLVVADLEDWPMPEPRIKLRKAQYVVPPPESDTESEDEYMTAEGSDNDDDDVPLAVLKRRWAQDDD